MQIFSDLVVLELASVLAGPSVGQFFAELGATVIKIENAETGGDVTRCWRTAAEPADSSVSAYFSCANWGKKSVLLNLKNQLATKAVHQLAAKADVVIASYKAGDAEKLQMDYATLSAINPKLIYGRITGYGSKVARAGYDAVIQAESGFMYLNGAADGPPTKMPVALIDILAAHQLKEGILALLYARERTGKGDVVEVSLLDAALASLANQATNLLVSGENPKRMGSEHPNIVPYGTVFYAKHNQPLVLAVGDDRQFARLCQVLQLPGLPVKPEFKTNKARVQNRKILLDQLTPAIANMDRGALLEALQACHVPAGAVYDLEEVFSLPSGRQMLLHDNSVGGFAKPGVRHVAFQQAGGERVKNMAGPPEAGAHTAEILAAFTSLSPEEISSLTENLTVF
ncbi:MAG: CoA transferase, partial [Hymenobacteraceae bacterium]|nr:CoA transferase [Hymenobacteraceae bacterium]MDX5396152.1 CoA transferase [Hymenobacteraceae bacterium]MDX5512215.1 CoA transferase [Hymenobacteraceae bacterium]